MPSMTFRIGSAVKAVRAAYGESQLDLAHAIGFDSAGAISMLENSIRGKNRFDVIARIAYHYCIPVESLFYPLLSEKGAALDYMSLPIDNTDRTRELFLALFPIANSAKALNNPDFGRVFRMHKKAAAALVDRLQFQNDACSRCMALYDQSYRKTKLPEAAANSLWWILVCGLFHCYPKVFEGMNKLRHRSISKQAFYKNWYLPECSEENVHLHMALKKEFHARYALEMQTLLSSLYRQTSGCPLAEYYSALFYLTGLSLTGKQTGESRSIGYEMMSALSKLGNQYAMNCLEAADQFHTL